MHSQHPSPDQTVAAQKLKANKLHYLHWPITEAGDLTFSAQPQRSFTAEDRPHCQIGGTFHWHNALQKSGLSEKVPFDVGQPRGPSFRTATARFDYR